MVNSTFNGQQTSSNSPNPGFRLQPQPKGTGFVNLNQYLQANQGLNLGNTLAQGVQGDVNKVNQGLQNTQNQFNQGLNSVNNQTGNYQNQANQTFSNLDTNYNKLNQDYQANPNSYQANQYQSHNLLQPNDAQTFQNIRNYQYTGPTDLNNIGQIQQQALQTQNLGALTNSNAGRAALLGRYVNNPQYNSFQQNLDSLYLQNAQPQLKSAFNASRNLYNQTQEAENNALSQANLARQNINDLKNNAASGISNRQNDLLNALSKRATQYQTDQANAINQLKSDLGSNKINSQEAALTGLGKGQVLYNLAPNVGNYLTPNQITNQNVSNVADRANLFALSQLAGSNSPAFDLSGDQYKNSNPYQFDKSRFGSDIDAANAQYQQAYNSAANPFYQSFVNPQQQFSGDLKPLDYGLMDKTASQQLNDLLAKADSNGIIAGQAGNRPITYDVNQQIAQLRSMLNGISNQYGANNILNSY